MCRLNKILIVDDDVMFLKYMKILLDDNCDNLITAENADDAMSLILNDKDIQLVITDYVMPDDSPSRVLSSGGDLVTEIMSKSLNSEKKHIPIIVITGYDDIVSSILAFNSPYIRALPKPLVPKELNKIIDDMVSSGIIYVVKEAITKIREVFKEINKSLIQ